MRIISWVMAALIMALNIILVIDTLEAWFSGNINKFVFILVIIFILALIGLLIYIIFEPFINRIKPQDDVWIHHLQKVPSIIKIEPYRRIALSLDFSKNDQSILSHAAHLSTFETEIVLLHVVESAGAAIYGGNINDNETIADSVMLDNYANALREMGYKHVETEMGYGKLSSALPKLINKHQVDIAIFGSHGHKLFGDLLFGSSIDKIKHQLNVPILIANPMNYEPVIENK